MDWSITCDPVDSDAGGLEEEQVKPVARVVGCFVGSELLFVEQGIDIFFDVLHQPVVAAGRAIGKTEFGELPLLKPDPRLKPGWRIVGNVPGGQQTVNAAVLYKGLGDRIFVGRVDACECARLKHQPQWLIRIK